MIHRHRITRLEDQVKDIPRRPTNMGGYGLQGVHGQARFYPEPPDTQVLKTVGNTLDSNGYQPCYVVMYRYGMEDTSTWPQARIEMSTVPFTTFPDGAYIFGIQYSFTSDGYMLLKPTLYTQAFTMSSYISTIMYDTTTHKLQAIRNWCNVQVTSIGTWELITQATTCST